MVIYNYLKWIFSVKITADCKRSIASVVQVGGNSSAVNGVPLVHGLNQSVSHGDIIEVSK